MDSAGPCRCTQFHEHAALRKSRCNECVFGRVWKGLYRKSELLKYRQLKWLRADHLNQRRKPTHRRALSPAWSEANLLSVFYTALHGGVRPFAKVRIPWASHPCRDCMNDSRAASIGFCRCISLPLDVVFSVY